MPNWCQNRCIFSGPPAELSRLRELMDNGSEGLFDFGKVLPLPEELLAIHADQQVIDGVGYPAWRSMGPDTTGTHREMRVGVTQQDLDALVSKYGSADWYSWTTENWGTKWGACDAEVDEEVQGQLTYDFNTAWGPPDPFLNTLMALFPELMLVHMYAEPGASFGGTAQYENGIMVEQESASGEDIRSLSEWHDDQMGAPDDEDEESNDWTDEDEEDDDSDEEE